MIKHQAAEATGRPISEFQEPEGESSQAATTFASSLDGFREGLHLSVGGGKDVVREDKRERKGNPKRKMWKVGRIPKLKGHWKDAPHQEPYRRLMKLAEKFLVNFFMHTNLCAIHAKMCMIMPKDMQLVWRIWEDCRYISDKFKRSS